MEFDESNHDGFVIKHTLANLSVRSSRNKRKGPPGTDIQAHDEFKTPIIMQCVETSS
jgi:hypothetical protein